MIIIERSTWRARHGVGQRQPSRVEPVELVIAHHFWRPHVPAHASPDREREIMRSVEHFHGGSKEQGNRGWAGIGYNFVIFLSGRIYEGRGWGRIGAHVENHNTGSLGVAFAMDGDAHTLTTEARDACRSLIAHGVVEGHIAPSYEVTGHRDYTASSCPGDLVYPRLQELRPEHDDTQPVVGLWDRGPAVEEVQERLGLGVSGVFDRATGRAVTVFQRRHRLEDDGIVGPQTWPVLRAHGPDEPPEPPDKAA